MNEDDPILFSYFDVILSKTVDVRKSMMNELTEPANRTLKPIKNLWSNGPGYIGYCPEDGTILLGKSGDSEWVEIPKHIADLFSFDVEVPKEIE